LGISHLKNEVLQVMDRLPEERQRQVLNFARSLASSGPVGIVGKDLLRFAGILTEQEAQALSEAVEEGCERVDLDEGNLL
jgi:hypothetical protein